MEAAPSPLATEDCQAPCPAHNRPMFSRMQFSGAWRDYQARILGELEGHLGDNRVHVVAAPGAGKTVLGLEIVRRIGCPALVLAPTVAIRDQWAQRLQALFLSDPGAGEVSRDLGRPAALTLATYQALDAHRRAEGMDALASALARLGPVTLVLDEAHHLRREWWRSLELLAAARGEGRIVALTATPPYDASFLEWERYESLCGPIDLEVGIAELVRNGDLCPHQDHVLLSRPTEDVLALLDRRRAAIATLQRELWADGPLLDHLLAHPWLAAPEDNVEAILEAPEMLSAILVLLHAAGKTLPGPPLDLLGVSRRDIPPPSFFWLEVFLEGVTGRFADAFGIGDSRRKTLRGRLHAEGLIDGGRVRLHQTQSVFRRMASSLAKLDSIAGIARAEQALLGESLRMVVLSDHIRAGELPETAGEAFQPARLGVVPIFETLRRAGIVPDVLGVLTGTLVIVPRAVLPGLEELAAGLGFGPDAFRACDLAACPDHVRLEPVGGGAAGLVRLVTALFTRGQIRILVGTQSLLGEGWDAPALNSLVLASNTASFMLSNQMRGRAIRIDPADPGKVANIWHLATLDASPDDALGALRDRMDWGYLGDESGGMSDALLLERRFRAFEGISNGESTLIESGIGRLGIGAGLDQAAVNERSFALAADRAGTARRWAVSLGEAGPHARIRETAAPDYAPRRLSWYDTLHALVWTALAAAGVAVANELRHVDALRPLDRIGMALAGIALLASLPALARALRLLWRNGSVEKSLRQVGETILEALHFAGIAGDEELGAGHFEVSTTLDGRKDVVLSGVSRSTERAVMEAIAEVLGPVQNPRYLLVRRSWLGLRRRTDYHAVPTALAGRKAWAERFAALWSARVGSSRLVYTRTPEGRLLLLRARARSFAAGFRRSVDRRSAWL